jgi:hypothetical protein
MEMGYGKKQRLLLKRITKAKKKKNQPKNTGKSYLFVEILQKKKVTQLQNIQKTWKITLPLL